MGPSNRWGWILHHRGEYCDLEESRMIHKLETITLKDVLRYSFSKELRALNRYNSIL